MALVNPNIAMSVKPLEIPQRNALAEAAQVMSLQQAQMQMEKLRQTDEAMERIRQAAVKNGGPGDLNEIAQAFLQSPDLGHQQLGLRIREQQREKQEFETMGRKLYPQLFGAAPSAAVPAAEPTAAPVEPTGVQVGAPIAAPNVMAAPLTAPRNAMAAPAAAPAANALAAPGAAQQLSPSGKTRQELEGLIFMAQRNPLFKGMAETAKLELAEMMKAPVYHNVPGVGLVDPRTKQVIMPSIESTPTEIKQYELAKQQGFKGTFFDYKRQLAEATRAPAQPVAPSITQIVDPTDPNKMITVDARRYQGGGAGAPGVIGVAGKEPGAALRTNKIEEGKTTLFNVIEDVKSHYQALKDAGDISSTEANPLANVISAGQSSALGQWAGRTFGTESQRARENIKSSRLILLNALKQATGKSAQELNSNVELKTNLEALSDPSQGYETAMDILNKLEDIYVRGVAPVKKAPAGTSAPPAAPAAAAPSSIRSQADAILRGGKP